MSSRASFQARDTLQRRQRAAFIMRASFFVWASVLTIACSVLCLPCSGQDAASVDVLAHIRYVTKQDTKPRSKSDTKPRQQNDAMPVNQHTVVWLLPSGTVPAPLAKPGKYIMKQQGKQFHPHLMVIAAGSTVSFPNADPFFHNVFSLFNGRRFDLGLYQAGQTRDVAFNRVGVSYIFCNIHPEMSAVIVSLDTPYYALPDSNEQISLHSVPAGEYVLQVWSESSSPEALRELSRTVTIGRSSVNLGEIVIPVSSSSLADHLNKFGAAYDTHSSQAPYP